MRLTLIPGVRLDQIAARAVERFQTQTQNHHLVAQFEAGFPTIQGDEIRLRQVLDNLISNAIKYSPKGGTITISGTFNAQHVICSVSDHGVGIADRDQEQLFERFFRVEDALSRTTQGTGLGLYLARAVVEAHHGHIAVISKIGQGSTFTFTLPRERVLVLESKHKEQP
jgi:signal transduction histidine kinase